MWVGGGREAGKEFRVVCVEGGRERRRQCDFRGGGGGGGEERAGFCV